MHEKSINRKYSAPMAKIFGNLFGFELMALNNIYATYRVVHALGVQSNHGGAGPEDRTLKSSAPN
jgi:hypothetical protein